MNSRLLEIIQEARAMRGSPSTCVQLDKVIDLLEDIAPISDSTQESLRLQELSNLFVARYEVSQVQRDLTEALGFAEKAVAIFQDDDPERITALFTLSQCRRGRFRHLGKKRDLQEMLALSASIVSLCPAGHPLHLKALENCVADFYATFTRTGNVAHLDAAISIREQILESSSQDSSARSIALEKLSDSLVKRSHVQKDPRDIEQAIALRRERLALYPSGNLSDTRVSCLGQLASALLMRYNLLRDAEDLNEATRLYQERINACPSDSPYRVPFLTDFTHTFKMQVLETPQAHDIDQLLTHFRHLLDLMPLTHPDRGATLASYAGTLHLRVKLNPSQSSKQEVEQCITVWRDAVRICAPEDEDFPYRTVGLVSALELQLEEAPDDDTLTSEILELRQRSLERTSLEDPLHVELLMDIGESFRIRYNRTHDVQDLETAASYLEDARALVSEEEDSVRTLTLLGDILFLKLGRSGSLKIDAWNDLVSLREEALRLCSSDTTSLRPRLCELLAIALKNVHVASWRPQYLERAIDYFREAVNVTLDSDSLKPELLSNLCNSLMTLHLVANDPAPIEEALKWNVKALELLPETASNRPEYLRRQADALRRRYMYEGDEKDVDQALDLLSKALDKAEQHEDQLRCMDSQAVTYRSRYSVRQSLEDLKTALRVHEKALALVTPTTDRALWRELAEGLVRDLRHLADESEDVQILFRAIALEEEVLQSYPESHGDKARSAGLLGEVLLDAYLRTADPAHLEDVISRCRSITGSEQTTQGIAHLLLLSTYCKALRIRLSQFKDPRDMEELALLQRQMIDFQIGDKFDFSSALLKMDPWSEEERGEVSTQQEREHAYGGAVNRYNAVFDKVVRHRRHFEQSGNLEDIDEAISVCTDAITNWFSEDSQFRTSLCSLTASLYDKRFPQSKLVSDLDSAILWAQDAVDHTPDHATRRDKRMFELAQLKVMRYSGGGENDRQELAASLQLLENLSRSHDSEIHLRFDAAKTWATRAAENDFHESALAALRTLFTILPKLAWLGSDTRASLYSIAAARNLPAQAATYALRYSTIQEAIEFLEAGRAVIWTQATRLQRPLDDVEAVSPKVANRLKELSRKVESHTRGDSKIEGGGRDEGASLRREWFAVVDEVKSLPGFEHFLDYSPYEALSEVSREGPVVILVDDDQCCTAIILSSPDVPPRWIPLTISVKKLQVLHKRLRTFANSRGGNSGAVDDTAAAGGFRAGKARAPSKSSAEEDILAVLWTDVAQPVIQSLTGGTAPKFEERRRIWWCCAGYFSFMPIHAAGKYKGREKIGVSDFFISSYTPTLRTLLEARGRSVPHDHKILPIIQPNPGAGFNPLPKTRDELREIYNAVSPHMILPLGGDGEIDLEGTYATAPNVASRLSEASILHLACHGVQESSNPLQSGFILKDGGRLTVEDLMNQRLPLASMAFLSACYTASSDVERPDEAINLANGMLFAGFSSVSATMWPMGDAEGPVVTRAIYRKLFQESEGKPDGRLVSVALDAAVRELRKSVPWEQWAVFIHIGI